MSTPRVFISHASEDKPFVVELAKRLRNDGVDAWLDQWEIGVGESLVDKIFTQGIAQCDGFLIVLSDTSVNKPWVKEELNAGIIEAIERAAKLFPIRIDGCAVPAALKGRKWLNLDPSGYDIEYRELLGGIYGQQNKPPVGKVPGFVAQQISGYSIDESKVLRLLIRVALEHGTDAALDAESAAAQLPEVGEDALFDAVEMLEDDGVARVEKFLGGNYWARISAYGWMQYAKEAAGIDAEQDAARVLSVVASERFANGISLHERTGLPETRIIFAVESLEDHGLLKVLKTLGGPLEGLAQIECTPAGRRAARH